MPKMKGYKEINIKFGNKLRKLREDSGFHQYEFAYACDISDAYYGRIERGEHSPSLEILEKIAKTLCIPLSELLKNIENENVN